MSEKAYETAIVPAIGVSGLIFHDDRVLLICRNKAPALGQWSLPGGKLEAGESLIAACAREVREETGLSVTVRHIVAVVERRIETFHYIIIDFLAELTPASSIEPIAADDVSAACWVPVNELTHYDLVEGLLDIIRRAYRCRQQSSNFGLCDFGKHGVDFILP